MVSSITCATLGKEAKVFQFHRLFYLAAFYHSRKYEDALSLLRVNPHEAMRPKEYLLQRGLIVFAESGSKRDVGSSVVTLTQKGKDLLDAFSMDVGLNLCDKPMKFRLGFPYGEIKSKFPRSSVSVMLSESSPKGFTMEGLRVLLENGKNGKAVAAATL